MLPSKPLEVKISGRGRPSPAGKTLMNKGKQHSKKKIYAGVKMLQSQTGTALTEN
jgi:hypothetical protein